MRKKIFGGLVALALALVPVAGANAAPYPPSGDTLHGVLDKHIGAPGDRITYTAQAETYAAEEALTQKIRGNQGHTATLASTTATAAVATEATYAKPAAADGSHTFSFTIPLAAEHGDEFDVEVLRADGAIWDSFVVTTVVQSAETTDPGTGPGDGSDSAAGAGTGSGSNDTGGLAMTGADIAITGIASGAALLLAVGVALLIVRWRRSSADATA